MAIRKSLLKTRRTDGWIYVKWSNKEALAGNIDVKQLIEKSEIVLNFLFMTSKASRISYKSSLFFSLFDIVWDLYLFFPREYTTKKA